MNLEGRLLGNRYEIIEKVGNGGMATVYKAKCHVLNRYVAVKVLREEFTTDEEFIKRFNTEAQAAASLTHPNIVSVYDVGNEGDLHYIVMELIKGKTLKDIINEDGKLAWKWSVNVAIQIASALETAHKNHIIHRDIKPHNIIITEDGIAKVTDFGIAKAVSNSTITAFGSTIGSVHYFSPEHARGGFTDPKSDLYSLGVVLYEMVTGKLPFNADTPVSVALKHMQETPTEPIEINPEVPKPINDIIMKAMQKDINLRYQTATEMLKDLSRAAKNPTGDFVVIDKQENDFPTQRISTIYDKSDVREEKRKDGFMKKHKILLTVIGIILLFALTIFGTNMLLNAFAKKDVQIPNLVGKEQTQAKSEAEASKLLFEISGEEFSKEVTAGCIISQEPPYAENFAVKEGSIISVVISKGRNLVTVPKVIGKKVDEATTELEALGLKVIVEEEYNKKVEAGYVTEQSIEAKTDIDAGETITIKASKGVETVIVPNLTGKTEDVAKDMIKESGLTLRYTYTDVDESMPDGVVVYQDLDPNTEVEKGSYINISINVLPTEKKATVVVNVKSLLERNGKTTSNEDGTDKMVRVDIQVENVSILSEDQQMVNAKTESFVAEFTNKSWVNIKVLIDGIRYTEEWTGMDLESQTSITID